MSAPGTPKASEAAIAAVQNAIGCEPNPWSAKAGRGVPATMPDGEIWSHCATHHGGQRWTERGCPVAVAAADAAAPWIAAQTLRDIARDLTIGLSAREANALDYRADRIEASDASE